MAIPTPLHLPPHAAALQSSSTYSQLAISTSRCNLGHARRLQSRDCTGSGLRLQRIFFSDSHRLLGMETLRDYGADWATGLGIASKSRGIARQNLPG